MTNKPLDYFALFEIAGSGEVLDWEFYGGVENILEAGYVEGLWPEKRSSQNGFIHLRVATTLALLLKIESGTFIPTRNLKLWYDNGVPQTALTCLDKAIDLGWLTSADNILTSTDKLRAIAGLNQEQAQ